MVRDAALARVGDHIADLVRVSIGICAAVAYVLKKLNVADLTLLIQFVLNELHGDFKGGAISSGLGRRRDRLLCVGRGKGYQTKNKNNRA
jgi:hypothetical protein